MGIAIDGTGAGIFYTIASPATITAGTIAGWFRSDATPTRYVQLMTISGLTTFTDYNNIGYSSNTIGGTYFNTAYPDSESFNATTYPGSFTITVGTWCYLAMTWSGTAFSFYGRNYSDSAFYIYSASGASGVDGSVSAKYLRIGGGVDGTTTYTAKGTFAGVKFYSAQLSATEIGLEAGQLAPVRRTNLIAAYPLVSDATDWSGAGQTLSYAGAADSTWTDSPVPMFTTRTPQFTTPSPALIRAANW